MRRPVPFTAAGLAAVIAAALLVRDDRAGEHGRAAPGELQAGAGAFASGDEHMMRALRAFEASAGRELPSPQAAAVRPSPVARFLESHSAGEVALLARFERLTGRAAPPALLELIGRRREGAREDELVALATRRLQGDPLGRAAVLEWLREGASR